MKPHLLTCVLSLLPTFTFTLEVVEVTLNPVMNNLTLSNRLNTTQSTQYLLGQPYSLTCSVAPLVQIKKCTWQLGSGPRFPVSVSRTVIMTGVESWMDSQSCYIIIPVLALEHTGTWSCRVDHTASVQWQEAAFEVVEDTRNINVRLPSNMAPSSYQVHLIPFLIEDNFTIAGHVDIIIDVTQPSDNITLHLNDIIVHENDVTVQADTGDMLEVLGHRYDTARQFYTVFLSKAPVSAKLRLTIFFTGNLNDELSGFYRSSYDKGDSKTKTWLATTQFEPTAARRAFPCFDEPAMKAIFQINLGRLPSMISISNMPIETEGVVIPGSEYVWDVYEESLRMSTYLVAFVVSDFVYRKSEVLNTGVEYRIWSRQGAYSQTEWAAQIAPTILAYYEHYFNTSFPLPKQCMIAIPDFSAGAMENWGLITYREVAILYDEGKSSRSDKEYVAVVVAHELAHQWFGDLVTMEWWTDIWLNEGFASYTEYIGANYVSPETFILDRFVLESLQPALGYDALTSSHPISIPVNHPDEISEIFDTISYLKGGSIIRMMANYLGIETFNKGIANYLQANSFGNANQDTLWEYLTVAGQEDGTLVGISGKEIMDTWTVQMGYPVITLNRTYNNTGHATIKQDRFLLNPVDSENSTDEHEYTWWVPFSYTTVERGFNRTLPDIWISKELGRDVQDIVLGNVADSVPVIGNVQQTGFYRVNYDKTNWELLSALLQSNHTAIHRVNRAQILSDAFNLARAGLLDYITALNISLYLSKEEDYIPWEAALVGFSYLEQMMNRTPGWGKLRLYILGVLQPIYDRLGFEERPDESFLSEKLRISMLTVACRLGHQECEATSSSLLQEWMSLPNPDIDNPIPNSLRSTVLCTGIARGDRTHWDFLWERYLASNNANEKNNILGALACSKEVWVLQEYLDMSIREESGVRKQDGSRVIVAVSENILGRYIAWDWIRANWGKLYSYYDTSISSSVGRIISAVARDFNTPFYLGELEDFISDHKDELNSARRDAEVMVQGTKANIGWMLSHYQTVLDWLPDTKELRSQHMKMKTSRLETQKKDLISLLRNILNLTE